MKFGRALTARIYIWPVINGQARRLDRKWWPADGVAQHELAGAGIIGSGQNDETDRRSGLDIPA